MKKSIISVLSAILLTQNLAYSSEVEYSGLVEVSGGTILGSDMFSAGGVQSGITIDEGMRDNSSSLMSIGAGMDATNDRFKFQLIGSYGKLVNGDLTSNVLKVDAAAYYIGSQTNKFGIGMHVSSLSLFSPSWNGLANLSLQDSSAIVPGLAIFFGDELIVKATVDYVSGSKFIVNKQPVGVTLSSSTISVDGTMVQVALLYKF